MNSITERRVIHQVKIDPKISAPKIAASTSNTLGRSVSAETSQARLKFAKDHILKPQQFWNEVIFSDESNFNIFGSDGRRMVWRKPNTSYHTTPTVKHGVSRLKCYQESVIPPLRAVQKHQITSKEQLKSVLQEEWLNIAPETTRHLVESMPRRLEAVISAKAFRIYSKKGISSGFRSYGSRVVKVSDHGRHVMSSSPVPLKTHRVGQRCTLNLSRAEMSSRWCGAVVRRGGAISGDVHVT
ncbi:transposable element Tcb1 transposase [Trichonephila clavipes]|nr:transposable element Tcb1 transposase [Trichonephila clavipes]